MSVIARNNLAAGAWKLAGSFVTYARKHPVKSFVNITVPPALLVAATFAPAGLVALEAWGAFKLFQGYRIVHGRDKKINTQSRDEVVNAFAAAVTPLASATLITLSVATGLSYSPIEKLDRIEDAKYLANAQAMQNLKDNRWLIIDGHEMSVQGSASVNLKQFWTYDKKKFEATVAGDVSKIAKDSDGGTWFTYTDRATHNSGTFRIDRPLPAAPEGYEWGKVNRVDAPAPGQ